MPHDVFAPPRVTRLPAPPPAPLAALVALTAVAVAAAVALCATPAFAQTEHSTTPPDTATDTSTTDATTTDNSTDNSTDNAAAENTATDEFFGSLAAHIGFDWNNATSLAGADETFRFGAADLALVAGFNAGRVFRPELGLRCDLSPRRFENDAAETDKAALVSQIELLQLRDREAACRLNPNAVGCATITTDIANTEGRIAALNTEAARLRTRTARFFSFEPALRVFPPGLHGLFVRTGVAIDLPFSGDSLDIQARLRLGLGYEWRVSRPVALSFELDYAATFLAPETQPRGNYVGFRVGIIWFPDPFRLTSPPPVPEPPAFD